MRKLFLLPAMLCVAMAAAPVLADETAAAADGGTWIVVPLHDIQRGEVISDSDLSYQTVPLNRALPSVIASMNDLDGREARRYLRAGEPVRADDVRRPVLVAKGSTVTMTFDAPGITLSVTGRAMSDAGMGETVVVLNPVSYRQVSATVTGAGQVRAGDATEVRLPQVASSQTP
jgi:flagellar basal body P-ring formation protein FlgA